MAAKAILVLCAQALLIQSAFTQCINRAIDPRIGGPLIPGRSRPFDGLGLDAWPRGAGCGLIDITATSGGGLPVTSSSILPPTGLSIVSENVYEGPISVIGEVPFVGTAAVEGTLPTAGAGAINYGCGTGVTAMVSEGLSPALATGYGPGFGTAFGPGFGPAGIAPGIGCGCGRIL